MPPACLILDVWFGDGGSFQTAAREILEDRAFGPLVAVAALGQIDQCLAYGLQFGDPLLHLRDMFFRQSFDLRARAVLIAPKI